MYQLKDKFYDIIVVGAGHAGCEAALASARMGMKVLLLTMNLDNVALMPCNPSIGGPAKGNLVREIDALGGEMGRNIDYTLMQIRLLNTRKGPAVQALRGQADRKLYQRRMKQVLENTEGLYLKEGLVDDLIINNNQVEGVILREGFHIKSKSVILATGTYLRAEIFIGDIHYPGAPQGQQPAQALGDNLEKWLPLTRFKTGTPPRVNLRSLDYSRMEIQPGNDVLQGFSFETEALKVEQTPCWLTYTNESTHAIIKKNIDKAAMYSGAITGTGPRYCPSIESKLVQFPSRKGHQVFVEPEGFNTSEGYLSGLSTSLPADVQIEFLRTILGFENVEMMRPGYAIEYDCIDPRELDSTLSLKSINGLFCAGQLNGTSGYEEAAAQGIVAGINAGQHCLDENSVILDRAQAYIGVLIDDLVIKGTNEPYRMMTSRAEYRLLLRQDNADERLTPLGAKLGLISEERYSSFQKKWNMIYQEIDRLKNVQVGANPQVNEILEELCSSPIKHGFTLADLLKRPEISYKDLSKFSELPQLFPEVINEVQIKIKYEGYLKKQAIAVERFQKIERRSLDNVDFAKISGLSREASEKLTAVKPLTLGQASRVSGVTPADISVLMIYLEKSNR